MVAHAYHANEPYWLVDETALIAAKQASARLEQDPWVEIVLDKLGHLSEVSIKEAYELCFSPNDTEGLTQMKARRMTATLQRLNGVLRIVAEQDKAREAEQKLNQALE